MRGISGFAQDLNQSLNKFLFKPVLPFFTIDNKERYPNNVVLNTIVFGFQRRLEEEKDYVESWFSEKYVDKLSGKMKVTCDIFDGYYSDFLLNFGMEQLMGALED